MGKVSHENLIKPHEDRFEKNERDIQRLFNLYGKIIAPDGYLANLEDELEAKIEKIRLRLESKFNAIIILLISNLVAMIVRLAIKVTG